MAQKTEERYKKVGSTDFLIRIQFRQHSTWQGEIQWLGKKHEKRRFFRSFLEMIMLIQEALEKEGKVNTEINFQDWEDLTGGTLLEGK